MVSFFGLFGRQRRKKIVLDLDLARKFGVCFELLDDLRNNFDERNDSFYVPLQDINSALIELRDFGYDEGVVNLINSNILIFDESNFDSRFNEFKILYKNILVELKKLN